MRLGTQLLLCSFERCLVVVVGHQHQPGGGVCKPPGLTGDGLQGSRSFAQAKFERSAEPDASQNPEPDRPEHEHEHEHEHEPNGNLATLGLS